MSRDWDLGYLVVLSLSAVKEEDSFARPEEAAKGAYDSMTWVSGFT
jgi:hypothetical protein